MQKKCCSLGVATTTTYYIRFCNWALTSNTIFHQFHITVVVACLHIHFSRRLHSLSFGFNFGFRSSFRFSVVFPRSLSLFLPKCVACFFCFAPFYTTFYDCYRFSPPMLLVPSPFARFIYLTFYPHHFLDICVFAHPATVVWWCRTCARRTKKKQNKNETKRKKREKQMNNHK